MTPQSSTCFAAVSMVQWDKARHVRMTRSTGESASLVAQNAYIDALEDHGITGVDMVLRLEEIGHIVSPLTRAGSVKNDGLLLLGCCAVESFARRSVAGTTLPAVQWPLPGTVQYASCQFWGFPVTPFMRNCRSLCYAEPSFIEQGNNHETDTRRSIRIAVRVQ